VTPGPLDTVTMEELLAELFRRSPDSVVAYRYIPEGETEPHTCSQLTEDAVMANGLAKLLTKRAEAMIRVFADDEDDEEEDEWVK